MTVIDVFPGRYIGMHMVGPPKNLTRKYRKFAKLSSLSFHVTLHTSSRLDLMVGNRTGYNEIFLLVTYIVANIF